MADSLLNEKKYAGIVGFTQASSRQIYFQYFSYNDTWTGSTDRVTALMRKNLAFLLKHQCICKVFVGCACVWKWGVAVDNKNCDVGELQGEEVKGSFCCFWKVKNM